MTIVALARLSACECGYGTLDPQITIGTKYTVDLDSISWGRPGMTAFKLCTNY